MLRWHETRGAAVVVAPARTSSSVQLRTMAGRLGAFDAFLPQNARAPPQPPPFPPRASPLKSPALSPPASTSSRLAHPSVSRTASRAPLVPLRSSSILPAVHCPTAYSRRPAYYSSASSSYSPVSFARSAQKDFSSRPPRLQRIRFPMRTVTVLKLRLPVALFPAIILPLLHLLTPLLRTTQAFIPMGNYSTRDRRCSSGHDPRLQAVGQVVGQRAFRFCRLRIHGRMPHQGCQDQSANHFLNSRCSPCSNLHVDRGRFHGHLPLLLRCFCVSRIAAQGRLLHAVFVSRSRPPTLVALLRHL
ncbi:hypothetical protein C8J57DRAFT_728560 [Mycena rebaudengoi]|nr:hypothetical protein C8J57DRAFT_728560 [Mycena rebaudengoi]